MKKRLFLLCSILIMALGTSTLNAQDKELSNKPINLAVDDIRLGEPITYKSLAIFPLLASNKQNTWKFASLDQAMKGRKLKVKEWGSGSVPNLKVKNQGKDKTFIMAGEIVTGAKQDRMSAHDVLLKENSDVISLPVYCVEQNRWVMNSNEFSSGQSAGTNSLRKSAVQKKSQGKIWSDVAAKSKKSGVQSSTGTMQAVYRNAKIKKEIKKYQKAFSKLLDKSPDTIGFVVVIGGQITSADLFGNKKILTGVWKKLLKAIAVDAITETTNTDLEITKQDVQNFLNTGFDGSFKNISNPGLGKEYLIACKGDISGSTLVYKNQIVHMALFNADQDEKPRELRSNTPRIKADLESSSSSGNSINQSRAKESYSKGSSKLKNSKKTISTKKQKTRSSLNRNNASKSKHSK